MMMQPQMAPQTPPLNPALQALLTLVNGARQGMVAPVTHEGTPTVAGQVLQHAMPQAAQQAGTGAQIQGMQQQQAQQALMQMAQQQRPQPDPLGGGIATAPGAQGVRMSGGGIVGYAGAGEVEEEYEPGTYEGLRALKRLLQKLRAEGDPELEVGMLYGKNQRAVTGNDRSAISALGAGQLTKDATINKRYLAAPTNAADQNARLNDVASAEDDIRKWAENKFGNKGGAAAAPAAQMQGGIADLGPRPTVPTVPVPDMSGIQKRVEAADNAVSGIETAVPTLEQEIEAAKKRAAMEREWLMSQGLDPDRLKHELEASQKRLDRKLAYYDSLEADIKNRSQPLNSIKEFLLSARGNKGQGIGTVLASGSRGMDAYDASMRGEMKATVAERLAIEDAGAKEIAALNAAREATAMGQKDKAMAMIMEGQKWRNEKAKLQAEVGAKGTESLMHGIGAVSQANIANSQAGASGYHAFQSAFAQLMAAKMAQANHDPTAALFKSLVDANPKIKLLTDAAGKNAEILYSPEKRAAILKQIDDEMESIIARTPALSSMLGTRQNGTAAAPVPPGVKVTKIGS